MIHGIGVSPGISIGRALVLKKNKATLKGLSLSNDNELTEEIAHFDVAVNLAFQEIEALKSQAILARRTEDIDFLDMQIELITDPQMRADVVDKILSDRITANDALFNFLTDVIQLFMNMDDEYMRARSADIKDISNRIFKHLNPSVETPVRAFEPDTIIIAEDLAPSDTITMDVRYITGFVTQTGSKTSHTAIIAKSKGIPAVVNCAEILDVVQDHDVIVLDGATGHIYINPNASLLNDYLIKKAVYLENSEQLKRIKHRPAISTDGRQVTLSANISSADDMDSVFDHGGDGVGLLRTEMLFMDRHVLPDENEQFEFYRKVALRSKGKPVIVRTIDVGGDKQLPYLNLPAELNPFLGYRAIRICLDRKDLFITQLKAILRAAVWGDLKIMFPMISNIQEIRQAKQILEEAKAELRSENTPFDADIKIGIMIEIPSAAVTADILATEVDFFSIGTNDLCQYTLAVDRMNEKISQLYDPFNPGVLRLINHVIEQGHRHGVHVGMCGEMASDPLATLLLMGMGLSEFSMSPASIPMIKNRILNHSEAQAKTICQEVMEMDCSENIVAHLKNIRL